MSTTERAFRTPPWLTGMVDQRLTFVCQAFGITEDGSSVLSNALGVEVEDHFAGLAISTPLREPDATVDLRVWERSCDNCDTYCPEGTEFYTGHTVGTRGPVTIQLTYGVCGECAKTFDQQIIGFVIERNYDGKWVPITNTLDAEAADRLLTQQELVHPQRAHRLTPVYSQATPEHD